MPHRDIRHRAARPEDLEVIIDLMVESSRGGMVAAWGRLADRPRQWRSVARAQMRDRRGELGLHNVVVATAAEVIAGMMLLNAVPEHLEGGDLLGDLLRHVPGALLIREIAVAEPWRRQGVGEGLIRLALRLAATQGRAQVALTVNEENTGARRLYARLGFREDAAAPLFGHPGYTEGCGLILMSAPV